MPSVKPNEKQSDFISRCMSDPSVIKERPDQKARLGLCYGLYRSHKKKQKAKGSLKEPEWKDAIKDPVWIIED